MQSTVRDGMRLTGRETRDVSEDFRRKDGRQETVVATKRFSYRAPDNKHLRTEVRATST